MTDTRVAALPVEVVIRDSTSTARAAAIPVEVVIRNSTSSARAAAIPVEVVVMLDGYVPPVDPSGTRHLMLLGVGS